MISISKDFKFESAHSLYGYEGKCKFIHGHNYKVTIYIRNSQEYRWNKLNNNNMILDFGVLSSIVKKWIDDNWDHSFLINSDDHRWDSILDKTKHFKFNETNPTAEHMSSFLFKMANELLQSKNHLGYIEVFKVIVYENDSSKGIYEL